MPYSNIVPFPTCNANEVFANRWNPPRTGDWQADTRIGRERADEITELIRRDPDCANMLGALARDIIFQGEYKGAEVGFFQRLAERLISSGP